MGFYVFGKNMENEACYFHNSKINNSSAEKILGITISNKPNLKSDKRSGLCHIY